jgi:hypothetical protein
MVQKILKKRYSVDDSRKLERKGVKKGKRQRKVHL